MRKLDETQTILVVEDSDDDYEMMLDGFLQGKVIKNPIVRCEDGRDALNYLFHQPPYDDEDRYPLPGIILLDLNLPGIDGRGVLRRVKGDPTLSRIPIIVLTTSDDDKDVSDCYQLGANTYVQKPVDLSRFLAAIERLKEYWFEVAILPREAKYD
jgi:two-component system, response regulator